MEAGLLAIAAGKPIALTATDTQQARQDASQGSDEAAAFGRMMQALQKDAKQALTIDEKSSAASMKLIALSAVKQAAQGVQPRPNSDVTATVNLQAATLLVLPAEALPNGQILPTAHALEMQSEQGAGAIVVLPPQALQQLWGQALPELPEVLHETGALVLSAGGDHLLALSDALTAEELEAVAQWVQQLQEMIATPDAQDVQAVATDMGLSAALFTPLQGGFHELARDLKVGQISLTDSSSTKGQALAASLADAIAADDLSQLSDAELAKLDALVDRIAQRGVNQSSEALMQFGAMLDEQLGELRNLAEGATKHAASNADADMVSNLSASHASQQTRPHDDSLSLRVMQMTHAQTAGNATPAEQVKVTISQAFANGMDRVVIQLDPADLGRVDVRLDVGSDGRVQMVVQADNRDTLDLLQRDARLLEKALQEAGINASMQDMAFNLGQGKQSDEGEGDGAFAGNEVGAAGEPEQAAAEEWLQDAFASGYTLSIAQGLNIKV